MVGGLAFNVGNIAGAGLGMNAMFGLDPKIGGAISALLAIGVFLSKRAGLLLDRSLIGLGILMIVMTLIVAVTSNPPVGDALRQTIFPDVIDFPTITTIVGGTVGGYITYSGAHRLLDKGLVGEENLAAVTKASLTGIARHAECAASGLQIDGPAGLWIRTRNFVVLGHIDPYRA